MRIFIWKSYGDIGVYAVETISQLKSIFEDMVSCFEPWDMDKEVEYAKVKFNDPNITVDGAIKIIKFLMDKFGIGTHESFEFGTGFATLKE